MHAQIPVGVQYTPPMGMAIHPHTLSHTPTPTPTPTQTTTHKKSTQKVAFISSLLVAAAVICLHQLG